MRLLRMRVRRAGELLSGRIALNVSVREGCGTIQGNTLAPRASALFLVYSSRLTVVAISLM